MLATTDLGKALLYKYQPNGRTKPLQPTLSIEIVSDVKQKEVAQKIPIVAGHLTDDEKVLLVYDNDISLTFEKIVPDFSNKEQRLVRTGVKNPKERTQMETTKVMPTREDENARYYGPGNFKHSHWRQRKSLWWRHSLRTNNNTHYTLPESGFVASDVESFGDN